MLALRAPLGDFACWDTRAGDGTGALEDWGLCWNLLAGKSTLLTLALASHAGGLRALGSYFKSV